MKKVKAIAATVATIAMLAGTPAGASVRAIQRAQTYQYAGKTRVLLPQEIVDDINTWADKHVQDIYTWSEEDGEAWDAYYGGMEEGYNYAVQTILARLGYLDTDYTWADNSQTLKGVDKNWHETEAGKTFIEWEQHDFS